MLKMKKLRLDPRVWVGVDIVFFSYIFHLKYESYVSKDFLIESISIHLALNASSNAFIKKKHVCSIGTVWLIIRKVLVYEKTMIIVSYFMVYWKLKILKVLSVHSSYKIIKHYTKVIKTFQ